MLIKTVNEEKEVEVLEIISNYASVGLDGEDRLVLNIEPQRMNHNSLSGVNGDCHPRYLDIIRHREEHLNNNYEFEMKNPNIQHHIMTYGNPHSTSVTNIVALGGNSSYIATDIVYADETLSVGASFGFHADIPNTRMNCAITWIPLSAGSGDISLDIGAYQIQDGYGLTELSEYTTITDTVVEVYGIHETAWTTYFTLEGTGYNTYVRIVRNSGTYAGSIKILKVEMNYA